MFEINISKLLLWYKGIGELYGNFASLINEHILALHLVPLCERFGPLYSHNCFAFESYYGVLLKSKSGTHHMQEQMLHISGYSKAIQFTTEHLQISNETPIGYLLQQLDIPVTIVQNR